MGFKFNPFTGTLDTVDSPSGVFEELDVNGDITLDDGGTYTTTLQTITATANRTISLPDATGTVALVAGSSGQLVYNNAGAQAGAPGSTVGATGDVTLGLNGAASTPPLDITGTWFTGGTSTTTKPQVLIEPTGTTSTAWSTSGTGLGVNAASGFTGNLLDLQVNGTSQAFITSTGTLRVGAGSNSGGIITAGDNGFRTLQIGGSPSSNGLVAFRDGGVVSVRNTGSYSWVSDSNGGTGTIDLSLVRDAANVVKVTNGSSGDGTISAQHRLVGTAPATASSTGTAGDIRYDASYIYVCTATNTWKRAAISTW